MAESNYPPLELLLTISGVPIWSGWAGKYICFISNLDICNDGTGPSHNDPSYQAQTAYSPYLNADKDKYIVTPPQIRQMIGPVVMGCQGRVTNLVTRVTSPGVVGDIGPKTKTGECAYCLAKILNPSITHNTGDGSLRYLYEFWPDVAAVVDGTTYKLKPAGG